jgi:hypothetical protein
MMTSSPSAADASRVRTVNAGTRSKAYPRPGWALASGSEGAAKARSLASWRRI